MVPTAGPGGDNLTAVPAALTSALAGIRGYVMRRRTGVRARAFIAVNFRPNLRINSSNPIAGPFEKSFHLPVELPLFSGRPISPPAIQACCRDLRRLARMANIRSAAELSCQWGRGYDYTRTRPGFGRAGCSLVQKCKRGPNDFCRNRNLGPLLRLHDRDEATGKKSQNAPRGHPPRKLPGKSTPANPRRPPRSHVYDPIVLIHGH